MDGKTLFRCQAGIPIARTRAPTDLLSLSTVLSRPPLLSISHFTPQIHPFVVLLTNFALHKTLLFIFRDVLPEIHPATIPLDLVESRGYSKARNPRSKSSFISSSLAESQKCVTGSRTSNVVMSPRRSSRARTSQPTPSGTKHSNSSSSSLASGRASQSAAPEWKSFSRSQSSEDQDAVQTRRSRRSQNAAKDESTEAIDDDLEDEGEEEITRCICGNSEYPGPPMSTGDSTKGGAKSDPDQPAVAEDTTGWFIQCDDCKVWQHGGCVGIMDQETSPEEYYCEQCRKDLHTVTTNVNGYVTHRVLRIHG